FIAHAHDDDERDRRWRAQRRADLDGRAGGERLVLRDESAQRRRAVRKPLRGEACHCAFAPYLLAGFANGVGPGAAAVRLRGPALASHLNGLPELPDLFGRDRSPPFPRRLFHGVAAIFVDRVWLCAAGPGLQLPLHVWLPTEPPAARPLATHR